MSAHTITTAELAGLDEESIFLADIERRGGVFEAQDDNIFEGMTEEEVDRYADSFADQMEVIW